MKLTLKEIKALKNRSELNRFIDNSSIVDLEMLSIKLDDFIELLFLNGLDDTKEYTKAIDNQSKLNIAIMLLSNISKVSK
jgi:hypothetical protein